MIQPEILRSEEPHGPWSCRGCDVWDTLRAADEGDTESLRQLLEKDPDLYRAEFWYTQPLHLAVRRGHLEAVRLLLEAGADADANTLCGEDPLTTARDRGFESVARLLEDAIHRRGRRGAESADHEIHSAADRDDVVRVSTLLDADAQLIHLRDRSGGTALHRAVTASASSVIDLLLDRGADLHALHGDGAPLADNGYAPVNFQPIDLALWRGRPDIEVARMLIDRGAACDLPIASALGDLDRMRVLLDKDPGCIHASRPWGKRALSAAVESEKEDILRLLLERGADPNWPEGAGAPRGTALHAAARTGHRSFVELLLAHGADPNSSIDSSGSATFAARTPEIRALLLQNGGRLDPYDLVWLGEDEEAVRRVQADPGSADTGCGGVLAAACKLGKRELLIRFLAAGARVPPVLTECRSYLLTDPDMLRLLLESGMSPDLPNWRAATPLHDLCGRDGRGRARPNRRECAGILLDAGAAVSKKEEDYRSTPLGWAARHDLPDMVELLLERGAPTNLSDDEAWATPLAWARRRGHIRVTEILLAAGASA